MQEMEEVSFKKGHILFTSDRIENSIYFIESGLVRAYSSTENMEITFWFGMEGSAIISMNSYVNNKKGYEEIELLENSTLLKISHKILNQLYLEDIHIANWGRKFAEQELIKTEERLISRQFKSAKERYKELMEKQPELLKRVALGHIASYLGITQVSLSRIRNDI